MGRTLAPRTVQQFRDYVDQGECWEPSRDGTRTQLKSAPTIVQDLNNIISDSAVRTLMRKHYPELASQWRTRTLKITKTLEDSLMRTSRKLKTATASFPPITADEFAGAPQGLLTLTRSGKWIIKKPKGCE